MQTFLAASLLVAFAGVVLGQQKPAPDLKLRGNRFKPLTYSELNPEQKKLIDHVISGKRASAEGPFNVMLRSPEMGDLAQAFGAYTRYRSAIPQKLKEMAILMTARHWNAEFEWYAHNTYAKEAGLEQGVITAIRDGKRPAAMDAGEQAIYAFCDEMLKTAHVSDAAFKPVVAQFGEKGAVDLVGIIGYYNFVSMILNMDGYPLPNGATSELKPAK